MMDIWLTAYLGLLCSSASIESACRKLQVVVWIVVFNLSTPILVVYFFPEREFFIKPKIVLF